MQRVGDLASDPQRIIKWELLLAEEPAAQRLTIDVGHGEPELPIRLAAVVHAQDVWVLEARADPDLPKESLGSHHLRQIGVQDLDGDGAVVPNVVGEKDGSHAAVPELALDPVP